MPRVSVIVPALQAPDTLGDTLRALKRQDLDERFEVLVVDEGSVDQEAGRGISEAGWTLVPRPPGIGAGAARNLGAERARGEILAFTDADCAPRPDWLRCGLEAIEGLDLLQGAVVPDPSVRRGPFDRTVSIGGETGLFESANLFVRRELFERLDGFEDWLIPRSGGPLAEDVWFGWTARRAGARTGFSAEAVVEHAVFRRSMAGYAAERRRLEHFPAIMARIPELRARMAFLRVFLNRRTAALDLALAGLLASLLVGSWSLLAAAPYLLMSGRDALRWGRRSPAALLGGWLADLTGFAALLVGTVRYRTPLL